MKKKEAVLMQRDFENGKTRQAIQQKSRSRFNLRIKKIFGTKAAVTVIMRRGRFDLPSLEETTLKAQQQAEKGEGREDGSWTSTTRSEAVGLDGP